MPIQILSVGHEEALAIVKTILDKAALDGGSPVAVAVVDAAARLIAFSAMDGVVPASIKLSQSKAYSAVIGQRDTGIWADMAKEQVFDMRNWTDDNFTGFTGGITLKVQGGQIIGGVGVSGRRGAMAPHDTLLQDTELAGLGRDVILKQEDRIL